MYSHLPYTTINKTPLAVRSKWQQLYILHESLTPGKGYMPCTAYLPQIVLDVTVCMLILRMSYGCALLLPDIGNRWLILCTSLYLYLCCVTQGYARWESWIMNSGRDISELC